MKILILVILFILLFHKIKYTPICLSKTLWKKNILKSIEKNKQIDINEDEKTKQIGYVIILVLFLQLFLSILYIVLGSKIGTTEFIILSALQVISCIWNFINDLEDAKTIYSTDINDFTYRRFNRLFNLILDYIYYPWAIYMLLK